MAFCLRKQEEKWIPENRCRSASRSTGTGSFYLSVKKGSQIRRFFFPSCLYVSPPSFLKHGARVSPPPLLVCLGLLALSQHWGGGRRGSSPEKWERQIFRVFRTVAAAAADRRTYDLSFFATPGAARRFLPLPPFIRGC